MSNDQQSQPTATQPRRWPSLVVASLVLNGIMLAGLGVVALEVHSQGSPRSEGASTGSPTSSLAPAAPHARWVFQISGTTPTEAQPDGRVTLSLAPAPGTNLSRSNDSLEADVVGLTWNALDARPPSAGGNVLTALQMRLAVDKPVLVSAADTSRPGDGLFVTVPHALNVTSLLLFAPATGDLVVVTWPDGALHAWNPGAGAWQNVTSSSPYLVANLTEEST